MSRFSPSGVTQDRSGEIIGAAISDALSGINQRRQMHRLEAKQDAATQRQNAIQDAQLGEQGIHLTKPGELPPMFDVNVSGGPNVDGIVSRAITPLVAQQPRRPGATPFDEGGPIHAAVSRNLDIGPGYYVDRDQQDANAKRSAESQFQSILGAALAKGKAEDIVNPGARDLARRLTESEIARNERPPAPVAPPRIDPLSPQGIAAQERLARITASLRPQTVGPDGVPLGKPNAENLKNAAFYNIAQSEAPALDDMGATVSSNLLSRVPIFGNMFLKNSDPEYQAQQLAGDRWIMQWLRSTSGAAISNGELENYRRQYIPQPGDTPTTIAAKADARKAVEQSLRTMAGPAARQGDTGNVDLRLPPHVQTIDEMIKAGKSDAEIKAAMARGVH